MSEYKVKFRDRSGSVFVVGGYGQSKRDADKRVISISQAQKDIGAYHATPEHEAFGCARASWSDNTYIEVWRVWE